MRDALARTIPTEPPPRFREGMVAAAAPLTVTIAGNPVPCSHLAAYSPAAGDRVLVLFTLGAGVVLGKIVP